MQQISVLGEGLGTKYRERKKNLLQRHFVGASDAAGQKVKGIIAINFHYLLY